MDPLVLKSPKFFPNLHNVMQTGGKTDRKKAEVIKTQQRASILLANEGINLSLQRLH